MKAILLIFLVAFASCTTEVKEPELEVDINGLIKCINEVAPLIPDVMEIINLIKAADWAQVAIKAFELVQKGIPAVKDCIAAFKKELNLQVGCNPHCSIKCKGAKNQQKCMSDCMKHC